MKYLRPYFALGAGLLAAIPGAAAGHEYSALLREHKFAEVEQAAAARLRQDPRQPDALIARAEMLLVLGQGKRIDEAVTLGQACVAAHKEVSECHEILGDALAQKAMAGGMLAALGVAGDVRDAYLGALQADPSNWSARHSLLQFYLRAPGVAGGGRDKAEALAAATARLNADAGKLLQAALALADKRYDAAQAAAIAAAPHGNRQLEALQRAVLNAVGAAHAREHRAAQAEEAYRHLLRLYPAVSTGYLGLGRLRQEEGKCKEAQSWFEQANAADPSAAAHYRAGQCWQQLGDPVRARSAFQPALAAQPPLPASQMKDAQEQLKAVAK